MILEPRLGNIINPFPQHRRLALGPVDAKPAQRPGAFAVGFLLTTERPAIPRGQVLDGLERKRGKPRIRAYWMPVVRRPQSVSGILNDGQAVPGGDGIYRIQVTGVASPMHGHDGAGPRRNLRDK